MQNFEENFDEVIDTNENEEKEIEIESTDEGSETLEDLLDENNEKREKQTDNVDKEINKVEQTTKQSTNKQPNNNNSQDLIDNNGNIIAKAGAERRFYEENVRLKRERDHFNTNILPKIKQEYDNLMNKVESYNEAFKSMQAGDLSTQEIVAGLELVRQWKKSPKDTINFLLTQAKSYGIDIDENNSGINMSAISTMIDNKLQPFIQERENAQKSEQNYNEAVNYYNNFIRKYPDAEVHKNELAFLLQKNPNDSLEVAYYKLKNYYYQKGYSFDTPLAEIINKSKQSFNNINVNQNISNKNKKNYAKVNQNYDFIKDIIKENMN